MSEQTVTVQTEAGNATISESQVGDNPQSSPETQPEAVQATEQAETVDTPEIDQNTREARMDAIAAKRLADIAAVNAKPENTDKDSGEEPDETPAPYKTLKVNGKEKPVKDEDELLKLAQKGLAADEKFAEASKLTKTSEQRIKELEEKLAQFDSATLPGKDGTKKEALPKDEPLVFTADSIDKAVYGGDEEGTKIREEMARRLSTNVDPTEIKNQVRKEMRIEAAIESVSSADPIAKQLLADDKMVQIVDQYSEMLLRLEPSLSEAENIAKACKQAHMHFPELVMPEQKPAMAPARQVAQTKQAHAAGNVSAPAQRINVAPEPLSAVQAQAQAKAELKRLRGLI